MQEKFPDNAGLCASCKHARLIETQRKSVFVLCRAHKFEAALPKYPRLPVLSCPVYSPIENADTDGA
jgi:hypothetical protein